MSFSSKMASAKLTDTEVSLCVNSDVARAYNNAFTALNDANEAAKVDPRLVKGKSAAQQEAEDLIEKLSAEVDEASVTLKVTAMPFEDFTSLILNHPPREGNKTDEAVGFNTLSFYIEAAEATSEFVDDDGTSRKLSPDEWKELRAKLADGEWDSMIEAVDAVNRNPWGKGVPFLRSASKTILGSAATSNAPAISA